jgi:small subunit ribosomal protein S13
MSIASVRIENVVLRAGSHVVIALTDVYGIGRPTAQKICDKAAVTPSKKVKDLSEEELKSIREITSTLTLAGDLRRKVSSAIKRLGDIKCYRGLRHRQGLPVRGQRTRTNARTRKGRSGKPKRPISNAAKPASTK